MEQGLKIPKMKFFWEQNVHIQVQISFVKCFFWFHKFLCITCHSSKSIRPFLSLSIRFISNWTSSGLHFMFNLIKDCLTFQTKLTTYSIWKYIRVLRLWKRIFGCRFTSSKSMYPFLFTSSSSNTFRSFSSWFMTNVSNS